MQRLTDLFTFSVETNSTEDTVTNVSATTEHNTESTTSDSDFSKDDGENGGSKGKIAAIVISCVGAVCLVLLAGLLVSVSKAPNIFLFKFQFSVHNEKTSKEIELRPSM